MSANTNGKVSSDRLLAMRADVGPRASRAGLTSKSPIELTYEELLHLEAQLSLLNFAHEARIKYSVAQVAEAITAEALTELRAEYERRSAQRQADLAKQEASVQLAKLARSLKKQANDLGLDPEAFGKLLDGGEADQFRRAKAALIRRRAELKALAEELERKREEAELQAARIAREERREMLIRLRREAEAAGLTALRVAEILAKECQDDDFGPLERAIAEAKKPRIPMPVVSAEELAAA